MIIAVDKKRDRIDYIRHSTQEADCLQVFCLCEKLDFCNLINISIEFLPALQRLFKNIIIKGV